MKFTGLPEFIEYHSFEITAEKNKHTICSVSFIINPDRAEDYLLTAEQRKRVEIYSDSGDCVMKGIVSAVSVNYGITRTTADVTITSESLLLQEKCEERIFQNPNKTYRDILKTYPEVEIGICGHLNDTIEEIIYQHKTDDFSFLLYLAGRCETGLWITEEGKVSFGLINNKKTFSDDETVYQKSVLDKKLTATKFGREISLLTMEQIPNGSILLYNQTEYTICSVNICEEYNETYFRYKGFTNPDYEAADIRTLITKAKVTDNKDPDNQGKIQVQFTEFTDNSSEKTWIPYLTDFVGKNNAGIVMIPDIDDEVIICISDGTAYAVNSLRNEKIPENCCDIDKKYIAVEKSVFAIDENTVLVKQGDKMSNVITKDAVISENDKSKIRLDSSSVTIETENSGITINSEHIQSKNGKSVVTVASDKILAENNKGKLNISDSSVVLENGKSQLSLDNGKTGLSGTKIDFST